MTVQGKVLLEEVEGVGPLHLHPVQGVEEGAEQQEHLMPFVDPVEGAEEEDPTLDDILQTS